MFHSPPLSSTSEAEMMNIVPLIIKRTGRSSRDYSKWVVMEEKGKWGVVQEGTVMEKCYVGQ